MSVRRVPRITPGRQNILNRERNESSCGGINLAGERPKLVHELRAIWTEQITSKLLRQ